LLETFVFAGSWRRRRAVVKVRVVVAVLKGVVVKRHERKVLFRMREVMVAGEKDVLCC
jgi:hypothetical protein